MKSTAIFWPMLMHILLTMVLYVMLAVKKAKAIKLGQVNRQHTALDNKAWPNAVLKVSNNIANQFEVPVLFYVLSMLLYLLNTVGMLELSLAWAFVLSRLVHAYVHVGSNHVPLRLKCFLVGCLSVLGLLVLTAWHLATQI